MTLIFTREELSMLIMALEDRKSNAEGWELLRIEKLLAYLEAKLKEMK
jgi:hypothetical protein